MSHFVLLFLFVRNIQTSQWYLSARLTGEIKIHVSSFLSSVRLMNPHIQWEWTWRGTAHVTLRQLTEIAGRTAAKFAILPVLEILDSARKSELRDRFRNEKKPATEREREHQDTTRHDLLVVRKKFCRDNKNESMQPNSLTVMRAKSNKITVRKRRDLHVKEFGNYLSSPRMCDVRMKNLCSFVLIHADADRL